MTGCLDYGALASADGPVDAAGLHDLAPGVVTRDLETLDFPRALTCGSGLPSACANLAGDVTFCEDFEGAFPGARWAGPTGTGQIAQAGTFTCRGTNALSVLTTNGADTTFVTRNSVAAGAPVFVRAYVFFEMAGSAAYVTEELALHDDAGNTAGVGHFHDDIGRSSWAVTRSVSGFPKDFKGSSTVNDAGVPIGKLSTGAYYCVQLEVVPGLSNTGVMHVWVNDQPLTDLDYPTTFAQPTTLTIGIRQLAGTVAWTEKVWFDEILVASRYIPCGE